MSEHERPIPPFSDIHAEDGRVRVTLLYDPVVHGLDVALYIDSSGSMKDEFEYDVPIPDPSRPLSSGGAARPEGGKRGILARLFGFFAEEQRPAPAPRPQRYTNQVEPQARRLLKYLAAKDHDRTVRVCYWSTSCEHVANLHVDAVDAFKFKGAGFRGTHLRPALDDYIRDVEASPATRRGLMVVLTDGKLHDEESVVEATRAVARRMKAGELPPISFLLVGIGSEVDEEQLERLGHAEYEGIDHLWCHKIAEEIDDVSEVAATLVDETMFIEGASRLLDDRGRLLREFKERTPVVFEFAAYEGQKSFCLEMGGRRHDQRIPDEEEHEREAARA